MVTPQTSSIRLPGMIICVFCVLPFAACQHLKLARDSRGVAACAMFRFGFCQIRAFQHHKQPNASRPEGSGIRSFSELERVLVPRSCCLHMWRLCLSSRNRVAQMHSISKKKQCNASRAKGRLRQRQHRLKPQSANQSQIWV